MEGKERDWEEKIPSTVIGLCLSVVVSSEVVLCFPVKTRRKKARKTQTEKLNEPFEGKGELNAKKRCNEK